MLAWRLRILLGLFLVFACSACSPVKPWEKQDLARDDMQIDAGSVNASLMHHFYFSREASSGGNVFSGGGCGCN